MSKGAPFGSGSRPADHALSGHGRSGFDPLRIAEAPVDIQMALAVYDDASRAHLRDCWLGSDDPPEMIEARYKAQITAWGNLYREIQRWTGRHASEFEALSRVRDGDPQGRDLGLGGEAMPARSAQAETPQSSPTKESGNV